jgi:hypothetical protein
MPHVPQGFDNIEIPSGPPKPSEAKGTIPKRPAGTAIPKTETTQKISNPFMPKMSLANWQHNEKAVDDALGMPGPGLTTND